MIAWQTVAVTLMLAQPVVPSLIVTQKDEAALYFFVHSISHRSENRKGRPYVPDSIFGKEEIAKLAEVSHSPAFSQPPGYGADSSRPIARYRLNASDQKPSEYLRDHLGVTLFSKVLTYCRQTIESGIHTVPPPNKH